jgi:hypothetical protein
MHYSSLLCKGRFPLQLILVVRKINIRPKPNNRHKKVEIRSLSILMLKIS